MNEITTKEVIMVTPSPYEIQRFAEKVAYDFNPVHRVDARRQFINGDYSVCVLLANGLLPTELPVSLTFGRPLKPKQEILLNEEGIFSKSRESKFVVITPLDPIFRIIPGDFSLERYQNSTPEVLDQTIINEFFPNSSIPLGFLEQFCLISGEINGMAQEETGLIDNFFKSYGYKRGENPIAVYEEFQIQMSSTIEQNEMHQSQFCRVPLKPKFVNKPSIDKNNIFIAKVEFPYLIFSEEDENNFNTPIGKVKKIVNVRNFVKQ